MYGQGQTAMPSQNEDYNLKKKYGLQKIDAFLNQRNADPDMSVYTLGLDLTNLGLNLNDPTERIYATFVSPFSEAPSKKVDASNFVLPQCYSKSSATLDKKHYKKFPDETLIYIFYNYPDENHKYLAVDELYTRNWKYHYPTETWVQIDTTGKAGQSGCKYFNVSNWETVMTNQLDFSSEDFLTLNDFKTQVNSSNL